MSYKWRAGSRIKGLSADVAAALKAIKENRGFITPDAVVEEASDEASPLHPAFDWDDSVAAHRHRLSQARKLIRAVIVVPEGDDTLGAPKFVRVTSPGSSYYEEVSVVVRSEDLFASALKYLDMKLKAAATAVDELIRAAQSETQIRRARRIGEALSRVQQVMTAEAP